MDYGKSRMNPNWESLKDGDLFFIRAKWFIYAWYKIYIKNVKFWLVKLYIQRFLHRPEAIVRLGVRAFMVQDCLS